MTAGPIPVAARLDDVLAHFLDAAMTGEDQTARAAFADAQAHDLAAAGLERRTCGSPASWRP